MKILKLSKQQIESWGGAVVYHEAEKILERGAVLRAEWNEPFIEGAIARPAGELRTRCKVLPSGMIESFCPCFMNKEQGLVCAHVTALAIALLKRQTDPLREQKYQEEQRLARMAAEVSDDHFVRRSANGRTLKLLVELPPTWPGDFWNTRLALRCRLSDGHAAFSAKSFRESVTLSSNDDAILAVLEDIARGAPPEFLPLKPGDFVSLLPLLAKAGVVAVSPEPRAPFLNAAFNETTGEITLRLNMEGEASPRFIVHLNQGYVLLANTLHPLSALLPLPYHPLYQAPITIDRPNMLRFLNVELPSLQNLIPTQIDVSPDLFTVTPATPTFFLQCTGSPASIRARLFACYGSHQLPCAAPDSTALTFALPDPDDVMTYLTRNPRAEAAALRRVNAAGFPGASGASLDDITNKRALLNFLGCELPALHRLGWKITTEGKLAAYHETLDMAAPVVQVKTFPDQPNAFDISMHFEDTGGATLPPAEIQRALMRQDAYIEHKNRTILFDRYAILDMRDVFTDCPSRDGRKPGHFQIPLTYAPYVRASLSAIDGLDIEEPPAWQKLACQQNRDIRLASVPLGPLEKTLRPYQKEGVYWLHFVEKTGTSAILADEMGLGKTLQALTWISLKRTDPKAQGKPALIICPTSLLENWERESQTFTPHLKTLLITGPDRAALFAQIPEHDLIITSYALLRRDLDHYLSHTFSITLLDEAQHIKNPDTQNAQAAKQIRAVNRLVLTGTPIENSVTDLWSIMDFLMPDYLGPRDTFRQNYELPISRGADDAFSAQTKLRRKLHPFLLRRLKKDVAKDLPDKIQKISYCTLTPDQQNIYNQLLQESRRHITDLVNQQGFAKARMQILATLMRLRQACCHLHLIKNNPAATASKNPSAKLHQFLEFLDEAIDGGHRILLFSQFTSMLHIIEDELRQRAIDYCYLDGSTKSRLAEVQRFNTTPSIPIFLISLTAGGTGLNLTGADTVLHFDPWWNPAVENQATDRAHRIGQKRTVYSVKLITLHTIEEKVLQLQQKKLALINATLSATDPVLLESLSWDDVRELLQ